MRYPPVSQWITHRLVVIRTAAILAVTALIFSASARPANAAIDNCTTTDALRDPMRLIGANIVNPVREYGWWLVGLLLLITVLLGIFTNNASKGWKAVFWGFVLMTIVVALVGPGGILNFNGSGTSRC